MCVSRKFQASYHEVAIIYSLPSIIAALVLAGAIYEEALRDMV